MEHQLPIAKCCRSVPTDLGSRLSYAMSMCDVDAKTLGKKVGIRTSRIQEYMQSSRRPRARTIILICRALDIEPIWMGITYADTSDELTR